MANQPTCTSPTRYRTHTCWMSFSNILYFNHIFGVITWYFSKCIFPKPIQLQVRRCMVWSSILNQWSTVWCTGEDAFYLIAVAYDLDGNGLFGLLANGGRNLKIGRWTKLENHIFVPGIFVGGEYGNVCYTWIISYIYIYMYSIYIYMIYIYYRHIMMVSRNITVFPIYCSTTGDQIWFGKTWACRMVWTCSTTSAGRFDEWPACL